MAEHRPVGYTLKKRYQVLARTHFQVLGKPNHPIGASGVAGQHSIPNRSSPDFSSEHARRRNRPAVRRPAGNSKQHSGNSPAGKRPRPRRGLCRSPIQGKILLAIAKILLRRIRWRYCRPAAFNP